MNLPLCPLCADNHVGMCYAEYKTMIDQNESIEANHQQMVKVLVKPGEDILAQMTPEKANLVHAGMGIAGEAGELLDAIKKHTIYNKALDRYNVVEELGDLEFFMEQLRKALNVSREETLLVNMEKLAKRYAGFQYSDAQAHARADKQ